MASEHIHRWGLSDRARCQDCGRDAEEIADALAQELAQARALLEGIERILATNSDYNAVTEWRDQYHAFLARKE